MSFEQAVLLPYSLFKKNKQLLEKNPEDEQTSINADERIKQMLLENYYEENNKKARQVTTQKDIMNNTFDSIVNSFEVKEHPIVSAILKLLLNPSSPIKWNNNFEVIIENHLIPYSDIRELIKFVLGKYIITSSNDYPVGYYEFTKAIINVVPDVWLKIPRILERNREIAAKAKRRLAEIAAEYIRNTPQKSKTPLISKARTPLFTKSKTPLPVKPRTPLIAKSKTPLAGKPRTPLIAKSKTPKTIKRLAKKKSSKRIINDSEDEDEELFGTPLLGSVTKKWKVKE